MIDIKPHLGFQGGVPDCDSGLDAVWVTEPGVPSRRIALATRDAEASLIVLEYGLAQSQIEAIKQRLSERDCTVQSVVMPLKPEASEPDDEDDDDE